MSAQPQVGLSIGGFNELEVLRESGPGYYLDAGSGGDILLPAKYMPADAGVGDRIRVFVYRDSEDRLIATTAKPKACVGQFAVLRVVAVNPTGAFLDWGLEKDLFLPYREQRERVREGDMAMVYVYLDQVSQRVVATTKIGRYLSDAAPDLRPGDRVEGLVGVADERGYRIVVEDRWLGMIYCDELASPLTLGQRRGFWVARIRADNRLDLSVTPVGYDKVHALNLLILSALDAAGGALPYSDRSDPAAIRKKFGCSKKAFKMAIGVLNRERKIIILPDQIRRV